MILLICSAGRSIGLGHLSRMMALASSCRKSGERNIRFCILGEAVNMPDLNDYQLTIIPPAEDFINNVLRLINAEKPECVIFDIHSSLVNNGFEQVILELNKSRIFTIGVDSLLSYSKVLDVVWFPSFYLPSDFTATRPDNFIYGWDTYLIRKRLHDKKWENGNNLVVLTGGSDAAGMGKVLPTLLSKNLHEEVIINWVQGPFAPDPIIPANSKPNWIIHRNLTELDSLIVQCKYALTVFGVSFFELLQYGIPTVVFSPYGEKDRNELMALSEENVAVVSIDCQSAVDDLSHLMQNPDTASALSRSARYKMSVNGAERLAQLIISKKGV